MRHLVTRMCLALSILLTACGSGELVESDVLALELPDNPLAFSPPLAGKSLRAFGAIGDGRADDTEALQAAARSTGACLDGERLEYRVIGNITASGASFCLVNATIIQDIAPVGTSEYIKSLARAEPTLLASPLEVRDYPEDPQLTIAQHTALLRTLGLKTIYVTGPADSVFIQNVKINKGKYEDLGVGTEAAAIWIRGAKSAVVDNVEVFGKGRGFGVAIVESENVRINGLNVHDLTWREYAGDRPFVKARIRDTFGWNNSPIYRYIGKVLPDDPRFRVEHVIERKFAHVRVQEEISGLGIILTKNVEVTNSTIARLRARFDTGLIAWQTDGITVGHAANVTMKNVQISHVWEGIDMTGDPDGVDTFSLDHIRINDVHAFGLKFVYSTKNGVVRDVVVRNAGWSGVVFAGPLSNLRLVDTHVRETGMVHVTPVAENLWNHQGGTIIAGFRVMGGGNTEAAPRDLRVVESTAFNYEFPDVMHFGLLNDTPNFNVNVGNSLGVGRPADVIQGFGAGGNYTYAQTAEEYQRINGCDGDPLHLIWFWDKSTYSTNSAPWTLPRLTADLIDLMQRKIQYCVP